MKPSSTSSEALSGSVYVRAGNLGNEQPPQSLFSLLLDIETRLRAEERHDSLIQAGCRRPGKYKKARISPDTLNSSMRVESASG
jgi:hypothetical protein